MTQPPGPPLLFDGYPLWFNLTAAVVFVLAAAYLIAQIVVRVTRLGARALVGHDPVASSDAGLAPSLRLLRSAVFVLVVAVLLFPALELAGVETSFGLNPEALGRWLLESGLRIALVLLVSWLVLRIVGMGVLRLEAEVGQAGSPDALERAKRARTLGTLVKNTVGTMVTVIALLMILRELNLDITPILTGAGIVGLAVGFGAQTLVKDVISGFFLILENQVRVGDIASINGTNGLVEAITLRTVVLRDGSGAVHVFPNGAISTLSNMTKDFSYYMIDTAIGWDEDPDRVTVLLKDVGVAVRQDPRFGPFILDDLEVFGVDSFTDSQVVIKMRVKTVPQKQWDVGRELRRRIAKRFGEEGVVLPNRPVTFRIEPTRAVVDHASSEPATAEPRT